MLGQCIVSNNPYVRSTFTAALRLLLDLAPSCEPSRYGPDDGPLFRRHQRAAAKNGARLEAKGLEGTPPEDTDDRESTGGHVLDGESTLSLVDLSSDPSLSDEGTLTAAPYGFHVEAPRETALFLDHGPWSLGCHALPPGGQELRS
jgi:hypothetical protein